MNKKKIICFIFILLSHKLVFADLSTGSKGIQTYDKGDRLSKEKENEIKKNKYGFIRIRIAGDNEQNKHTTIRGRWALSLIINDKVYLGYSIFDSEEYYKIPVPAGRVEIKYKLAYKGSIDLNPDRMIINNYGNQDEPMSEVKVLIINVKETETINLNIIQKYHKESKWGCGAFFFGIPLPVKMPVNYVVYELEEQK